MPLHHSHIYKPPFWAKSPVAQTSLNRMKFRRWGANPMIENAKETIITTADGTRLQGFISLQKVRPGKGMIILIHGWEGSANSTYVYCMGKLLFNEGYDVFRLNFRDHGKTHHLNEGIFHGALIDEVYEAVVQASKLGGDQQVQIIGFSMGGNFTLRIALRGFENLKEIYAISPVLYPLKSTLKLANSKFEQYFREKWTRSLRKKAALFPDKYDFTELYEEPDMLKMTDILLKKYSDYPSVEAYFDQYTLTPERLAELKVPAIVITSTDDPVIDDGDYAAYGHLDKLHLYVQSYGGHVGFIGPFLRTSWYEKVVLQLTKD